MIEVFEIDILRCVHQKYKSNFGILSLNFASRRSLKSSECREILTPQRLSSCEANKQPNETLQNWAVAFSKPVASLPDVSDSNRDGAFRNFFSCGNTIDSGLGIRDGDLASGRP